VSGLDADVIFSNCLLIKQQISQPPQLKNHCFLGVFDVNCVHRISAVKSMSAFSSGTVIKHPGFELAIVFGIYPAVPTTRGRICRPLTTRIRAGLAVFESPMMDERLFFNFQDHVL
jgi:hypothetical protein